MSIQYSGSTIVNTTFTNDATKVNIMANIMAQLQAAGWSVASGVTPQTVTISIASPGVIAWSVNHNLFVGDVVSFTTTGALPTGLSVNTQYFIKTLVSSTQVTLSATFGGPVVNTSGTQSGVHTAASTIRMATAATPWGITSRVRIQDNGGGSATAPVVLSLENSTSALFGANGTNNGAQLVPVNGRVFRVIASKYQAFIFTPATSTFASVANFGTPYIPPFLQGIITECGWLQGNSAAGADAISRPSFRTVLRITAQCGLYQGIVNTNLLDAGNTSQGAGNVNVVASFPGTFAASQTGTHWHDGSAWMYEPLIMWANTSSAAEGLIRGQLWDAVVVGDTFAGDTTTTFDGHSWWALTDSNTSEKATIFIATT